MERRDINSSGVFPSPEGKGLGEILGGKTAETGNFSDDVQENITNVSENVEDLSSQKGFINSRLENFDGDALKFMFEEYIKAQFGEDFSKIEERRNFYLSNYYGTSSEQNSDNYNIKIFSKFELGLLCFVLYGEPSNLISEYEKLRNS